MCVYREKSESEKKYRFSPFSLLFRSIDRTNGLSRERKRRHERSHNSQELFDYCFNVNFVIISFPIGVGSFFLLLLSFLKFIIDLCMEMSRCQIVSFFFFLINRSSSFDNNDDHDYIIRSPTGDRRLTVFCVRYPYACRVSFWFMSEG